MSKLITVLITLALGSLLAAGNEASPEALDEQIVQLRQQARYAEATTAARHLLELKRGDPESKSFEIEDAERLVLTLEFASQLSEEDARDLARADSLAAFVQECNATARYDEGAAAAQLELDIRREIQEEDHHEIAMAVSMLGTLLHAAGDYERAESLLRESLATRRRVLGEEHPRVAFDLNELGLVLRDAGKYPEARPLLEEALALAEKLHGRLHLDVASALGNLGMLCQDLSEFTSAEAHYRESLEICRALLGDDHVEVGASMSNLATLLWELGDYAAAEPLLRRSISILRAHLGDEHPYVAISLQNLSLVLKGQGDYAAAEPLMREAIEILTAIVGPDHPHVSIFLSNLASILVERSEFDEALELTSRALEMKRERLGDVHRDVANSLGNLAFLRSERGEYAAAESLYLAALEMRRATTGPRSDDVASNLTSLSTNYWRRGMLEQAEPMLREALSIRRESAGPGNEHLLNTITGLGFVLRAQGRDDEALAAFEEACQVYEGARLRAGHGAARSTFARTPYDHRAQSLLVLGRTGEAWPAVEKALARTLTDLLMGAEARELTPSEEAREDSLKSALASLERQLSAYIRAAEPDTAVNARRLADETRNALMASEADWDRLQADLERNHPVSEGSTYALGKVQSLLGEHTALLGWLDVEVGDEEYDSWGYVIRSRGPVFWAHLTPDGASRGGRSPFTVCAEYRTELSRLETPYLVTRQSARELWDGRFAPLAGAIDGADKLIVIPSGAMLGIPVETLVDDQGLALVERYHISYVPSATLHVWLTERAQKEPDAGVKALAVGDPTFGRTPEQGDALLDTLQLASAAHVSTALARDALVGRSESLAALPRLRGTQEEVRALHDLAPDAVTMLGAEASEQALVALVESGELTDFDIIHLATHAFVDDDSPERSALVLSQTDLPDELECALKGTRIYDGLVTAGEIVREWTLDADLVTLSACQTALGREAWGEGYIGLAHSFFQAGARSLLVSLWKADDAATSLLMGRFYENYFGRYEGARDGREGEPMSKADALREAKVWLREHTDTKGERPYAHPYYWAAFVLIGDTP
jgi:CHAT domain-containing protein/tetratricopeptide (TPR) repeat protein